MAKPNAVRRLERERVAHVLHEVGADVTSGAAMAAALGVAPGLVLRTLVCELEYPGPAGAPGRRARTLVLCGSAAELDLKTLARAVGARRARLADRAEAERWTGLVRGGISPLAVPPGRFDVFVDSAPTAAPRVYVSAGRPGLELELAPADLLRVVGARAIDLGPGPRRR